ncbi:substrate-binding periplasmic protein [Thalassotalea fusca]
MNKLQLVAKLSLIALFVLCVFVFTVYVHAKYPPVEVKYQYDGKVHTLVGERTPEGYRFNSASNKVLTLATLEWPPYIGEELCNKGWVFQFTVALLVHKGYQVNIHFYPWARAVKMVETGQMDILFPEYFIEDSSPSDVIEGKKRRELLAQSNKFPGGNISFMKRKNDNIKFDGNLSNLRGQNIGVVRGYQNTPEFDAMMDAKLIDVVSAVDELQLMKMLVAKRVNLIIGDPLVFRYAVNYSDVTMNNKMALLDGVEEVSPAIKYNHLYYAVSVKSENWRSILDDINLALIEFDIAGETQRIIEAGSGCVADFTDI